MMVGDRDFLVTVIVPLTVETPQISKKPLPSSTIATFVVLCSVICIRHVFSHPLVSMKWNGIDMTNGKNHGIGLYFKN
jgi:hypothetical protein